jgi:hypothetical protein
MEQVATRIRIDEIEVTADIFQPDRPIGLVLFAHGSGSSRHSPRNRHVAEVLSRGAIGTVLTDLLTEEEEAIDIQTAELRFDVPLLGRRLVWITDWIGRHPGLNHLGLGYFGASTGAAAALVAAADRPNIVRAVVSRGGPARSGSGSAQASSGTDAFHCWRRRHSSPRSELLGYGSAPASDGTQARNRTGRHSPVRRGGRIG